MKKNFNYLLFFLVVFLVGFSFLFLACLTASTSLQKFGNTYYYLLHQFLAGFLPGIILGYGAYKISLHFLKKWAPLLVLANIVALFAVFIPGLGVSGGGASRWIRLGFFSFQPSEFLKITAIMYLAAWISSKLTEEKGKDWKSLTKENYHNFVYVFVPFLVFLGLIFVALILQKDLSTLGIVTVTLIILYFSSKTPLWHTLAIIAGGAGLLFYFVKSEPYRFNRFFVLLHPGTDPMGIGRQISQSLISLGSGGILGRGLGMSTQKFGFLSAAMSDSIFAIIGEELGIVGCVILIAAFLLLFWTGLKIARDSKDRFSKILATGIVVWITLQALINMAATAAIFPLAGIPLPFFSYGGTHIAVELIGIGLLLNISKNT